MLPGPIVCLDSIIGRVPRPGMAEVDRPIVVCDVRWYLDGRPGEAAYQQAHIPGAIFIDLADDLSDPTLAPDRGRHPLPDAEVFCDRIGQLGISRDDTVVAYDDSNGTIAGRFVWMLRAIGHDAALLDGGLSAWGDDIESGPSQARPAVEYPLVPWPDDLLVDADQTGEAAAAGVPVFDVRSPERYRGENEPADPRAGHIPGAVNLYLGGNTDETGRFLSKERLGERFAAAGVNGEEVAVVYCGSGVSACQTLLAIEQAGMGRQRLYPGSWSEWSNDTARPVSTGESP